MARIKIRGSGWLDDVSYQTAEKIAEYKKQNKPPATILDINGWVGSLGEISQIDLNFTSPTQRDHTDDIKKINQEFIELRQKSLKRPIEVRAKDLDMFSLLWWGATDKKEFPYEVQVFATAIQKVYFEENQKSAICSPHLFRELLPPAGVEVDRWHAHAMHVVERAYVEDLFHQRA